jgi:hypothetical protein
LGVGTFHILIALHDGTSKSEWSENQSCDTAK